VSPWGKEILPRFLFCALSPSFFDIRWRCFVRLHSHRSRQFQLGVALSSPQLFFNFSEVFPAPTDGGLDSPVSPGPPPLPPCRFRDPLGGPVGLPPVPPSSLLVPSVLTENCCLPFFPLSLFFFFWKDQPLFCPQMEAPLRRMPEGSFSFWSGPRDPPYCSGRLTQMASSSEWAYIRRLLFLTSGTLYLVASIWSSRCGFLATTRTPRFFFRCPAPQIFPRGELFLLSTCLYDGSRFVSPLFGRLRTFLPRSL